MLTLSAKLYFDTKQENSNALDNDLETKNTIRPAINFGEDLLFSGIINVKESVNTIERGQWYNATVKFPTIDNEAYNAIRSFLNPNVVFSIQVASRVIGKCIMVEYKYD